MILRKLNLLVESSMSESLLKTTDNQSPPWNVARASAVVCILFVTSLIGVNSALAQTDDAAIFASTEMSKLDINTADADELAQLPGLGPTIAARIIDHREAHGPFHAPEALLDVPGIGAATLAAIRPHLRPLGQP